MASRADQHEGQHVSTANRPEFVYRAHSPYDWYPGQPHREFQRFLIEKRTATRVYIEIGPYSEGSLIPRAWREKFFVLDRRELESTGKTSGLGSGPYRWEVFYADLEACQRDHPEPEPFTPDPSYIPPPKVTLLPYFGVGLDATADDVRAALELEGHRISPDTPEFALLQSRYTRAMDFVGRQPVSAK